MSELKTWLSAFRLRTLPLSISGIIVAGCLAEYNGYFKWNIFGLAILVTLSLQILSNLANDYGDGVKGTDNEDRIGPERALQSGKITKDQMLHAIRINILISIVLVVSLLFIAFSTKYLLLALLFFFIAFLCVRAALKYTIGDNAYGYRALGDIYVFIFFGLVSVIGGYVLFSKQFDHVVILPAITLGLLSAAVLNLNNMRDINSDTTANKITLAVKLGEKRAKKYHLFLIISAIVTSLFFGILYYNNSIWNFLFVLAYIPLLIHLKTVIKIEQQVKFDKELKKLALTTVLLAILLGIGHLF